MITRQQVTDGLKSGKLILEVSEWGDGSRGVGLYHRGNDCPIERIAIQHWHAEQEDGMQYADDPEHHWFYDVFGASELSNQARKLLQDHCSEHEDAILAWCNGDEDAVLPPIN